MGALSCSMWDLVTLPGIKPRPPALIQWGLSPWTTRLVPRVCCLTETRYSSKLACWSFYFSTAASLFGELYDLFIRDFHKQFALNSPELLVTGIAH